MFLSLSLIVIFADFSHQCVWPDNSDGRASHGCWCNDHSYRCASNDGRGNHSNGCTNNGFRWRHNDINGTRGSCWRRTCRSDSMYLSNMNIMYTRFSLTVNISSNFLFKLKRLIKTCRLFFKCTHTIGIHWHKKCIYCSLYMKISLVCYKLTSLFECQ